MGKVSLDVVCVPQAWALVENLEAANLGGRQVFIMLHQPHYTKLLKLLIPLPWNVVSA